MPITPTTKEVIVAIEDIRRNQESLLELREEFRAFVVADQAMHKEINEACHSTGTTIASYTLAGKIVWGVVGFVVVGIGSLMGWEVSRVNDLHNEITDMKTIVVSSMKVDESLQASVNELKDEVRELRRRLAKMD